ncbi:AMP-binding protein [Aeromicrobium sp.]|uniref:AMP-binding protein n=1 Tax=Aeromicrobium sp. TaxID=1871063 RepID=UPI0030BB5F6F
MTSLVFRVLDAQVVGGLADEIAVSDGRGTMSYAQLLHESASLAAGLRHMGIVAGTHVVIDLPPGRDRVAAVLACARITAVPHTTGDFRLKGTPPVLHAPDTEVTWDVLIKAGRTEPASAPESDPDGYDEMVRETYEDIFSTLAAGGTIT